MKMKQLNPTGFLVLFIFFFSFVSAAQTQKWSLIKNNETAISQEKLMVRKEMPTTYQLYNLKESAFRNKIGTVKQTKNKTIQIPTSQGLKTFYIEEASNFSKELAAKYVNIKTYSGKQVDNNAIKMKFSKGLDGYHFAVYEPGKPSFYIDSYTKDNKKLIAYSKKNLQKKVSNFTCEVLDLGGLKTASSFENKVTNDGLLRTFRLAVATTGEYSQYQLNRLNISSSATIAVKKEAVLSAINTTISRIGAVFENDLGVKFQLVENNDAIIFLDAENDGLSNDDPSSLINESQIKIDGNIGNDSYDVGHTFSTGAGGVARLGVVCVTNQKARGVTGIGAPFGDEFDIDFVAHEFGHQFGANHTFNGTTGSCSGNNRNNSTAVEPGSGTTIMGYAGICSGQNVLNDSHDNFHSVSIAEMTAIIRSSGSCATTSNANNTAPTADAGLDYTIPKSTPFILKGVATDVDEANGLTYNWEQINAEVGFLVPPDSTNGGGAMFRSLSSSTVSSRFMPTLSTVISGNTSSTWEVLPSVERVLDFSLTVRDNHSGAGSTARDDVRITVTDAVAFTVTSQNTAITWNAGSTQNITWSKGTSDVAPINCKNITIKLSIDGGLTFPITLNPNTANDGSEDIIVPNNVTTQARIMIEAADNIFYNVNEVNFEIESTSPSFVLKNNSGDLSACNSGNQTVDYTLNLDFINGFSEDVTFVASGQPTGSVVAFSPTTLNSDGDVVMSVSDLDGVTEQEYTINIQGNSASINQNIAVLLRITASSLDVVTLSSPEDGVANVSLTETLRWQAAVNASSYVVQVASDADFNTLLMNKTVITNTSVISGLDGDTLYYWRVKAQNSCNESSFSTVSSFTTEICNICDSSGDTDYQTSTTLVQFNTIDNASTKSGGYEDNTAISTSLKLNESYDLIVHANTDDTPSEAYRVQSKVWIDWNKNCSFNDEGEEYDLGSASATADGPTSLSPLSITVPSEAHIGEVIMRVSTIYTDPSPNITYPTSCMATFDGEVEDYTLIIEDTTAATEEVAFEVFNLFPNPTKGAFTLNLKLSNTAKISVQLYDVRGRLIDEKNYYNTEVDFSERIFFEKAASGLYVLKVINGNKQTTKKLIIR
jgi:hypothetical protein